MEYSWYSCTIFYVHCSLSLEGPGLTVGHRLLCRTDLILVATPAALRQGGASITAPDPRYRSRSRSRISCRVIILYLVVMSKIVHTRKRKAPDHSCGTRDLLPDPSSKKRFCGDVGLKKAFSLLNEIDVLSSCKPKISADQVLCLLISKFGWHAISGIASTINSLPNVLTEKQFSTFLERRCTELGVVLAGECADVDKVAQVLQNECGEFVSSFHKELLVLAPPLSECPTCSSSLVCYHECMARVYEMDGVTTLPKITLRCLNCKMLFGYSQFGNKKQLG